MPQGTRLVQPGIDEVSGVDWPAHLAPGWIVMRAAGDGDEKGEPMPPVVKPDAGEGGNAPEAAAEPATLAEALKALNAERAGRDEAIKAEVAKAVEKVTAEATEAAAEAVAKAAGKSPEDIAFEKALGELPEPFAKAWLADRERIAKAEKAAETERDARVSRDYLAKAADFGSLPANAEGIATTLRAIEETLPTEVAKEAVRLLTAGNEALKSAGIFNEIGGIGGEATSTTALDA